MNYQSQCNTDISPEQCRRNRANNTCSDEQCRANQHNADTWDAIAEVWEIMRGDRGGQQ